MFEKNKKADLQKQYELEKNYKELEKQKKEEIFFFPSEMILNDEIKDTSDKSKTMEFLLSEILNCDSINEQKIKLKEEIDNIIFQKNKMLNSCIEEVLNKNNW